MKRSNRKIKAMKRRELRASRNPRRMVRHQKRLAEHPVSLAASKSYDIVDTLEHVASQLNKDLVLAKKAFRAIYDGMQGWDSLSYKEQGKRLRSMRIEADRLSKYISEYGSDSLGNGVDNLVRILSSVEVKRD